MKTIKEHIESFSEPYRSQALENLSKQDPMSSDYLINNVDNALLCAFYWGDTEQGVNYWEDFFNTL